MSKKNSNDHEGNIRIHVVHIGEDTNEKERIDSMSNKNKKKYEENKNSPNAALHDFAKFLDKQFGDSHFTEALNTLKMAAEDSNKETDYPDLITNAQIGDIIHELCGNPKTKEDTEESGSNDQDELTYSEEALDAIHDVLATISYQLDKIINGMVIRNIQPANAKICEGLDLRKEIKRCVKKEVKKQLKWYLEEDPTVLETILRDIVKDLIHEASEDTDSGITNG